MKNKVVQSIDKEFALQQYYVNHCNNNVYLVFEDNESDELIFRKISKATSDEIYKCDLFIIIDDKIDKEPEPEQPTEEIHTKSKITINRELRDSKITELYKSGKRVMDIARELNCSDQTVRNTIHRLGLSNPTSKVSEDKADINLLNHDEFLRLYVLDNMSINEIANKYNCTISHIFKVMNNLGINENKKFYKEWRNKQC